MPELNFNALAQQGPQGVFQGFLQGQQLRNQMAAQEQQRLMGEQQRQLGEVQLQNALREQRSTAEEEAAYKAAGGNLARLQTELMQRGLGKQSLAVSAQLAKQRADQLKMHKDVIDLTKNAATQIMANPENAAQILTSFGQRYGIDMNDDLAQVQQLGGNADAIRQWAAGVALQADKLLPKFEKTDLGGTVQRQGFSPITGAPVTPAVVQEKTVTPGETLASQTARRGQDIGAQTAAAGQAITVRGQDLANTRELERIKLEGKRVGLEGRRVAVLEENLRRDADPAFQQRMAAAKATGDAIAKGDVAAQQALPKILSRAEEGIKLLDEMVGKQEVRDKNGKVIQAATAPHPGFQDAVGATWKPGARLVPGTNAADFQARFDQIKGASFLEAFESLKGGGAITEVEGTKATSAINRMALAQSEGEFVAAARDLQEVIRKGVERATRKAGGAVPAAAGGAKFLGFE